MDATMTLRVAAKINLMLSVPALREDGYHEISTVMQTVGLFDTLTIKKSDKITVSSENAPCGEENICYKAAKFFSPFGGADITIKKSIPLLSGLGGGSADAAATLLALNRLYGNPFGEDELVEKAMSLGSDVPFFIKGGTALIEGKGEKCLPCAPYNAHIVLIKDGKKQSTGYMYSELDRRGLKDRRDEVAAFCDALSSGKPVKFFNDFEAVFECKAVKEALRICGAEGVCLSGSGPTVFGAFATKEEALACVDKLKKGYAEVYYCPTVEKSVYFE
ncbi:MAG: 4-(cytidine 5'-diphospho)-2-C-methyl-D-erythritol kinase [Clostridia bacterium]|nr:4-(cytidine 5'-diphospho)-2-C-methyl-D-erythritol kinase [Clostridia bacterium]